MALRKYRVRLRRMNRRTDVVFSSWLDLDSAMVDAKLTGQFYATLMRCEVPLSEVGLYDLEICTKQGIRVDIFTPEIEIDTTRERKQ